MKCLCCGKPLLEESKCGWHENCVKRFFGTSSFPDIEIGEKELESIVSKSVKKGLTIPGVQKKLSLHLSSEHHHSRLTFIDYPTGYILKPQVKDFSHLPECEHLVMSMADITGIQTVPHALIKKGNTYAYITKRINRIIKESDVQKIAMEDFCQLDMRLTADKYKGSYERCAKVIKRYSSQASLDVSELFLRLVFAFATGNSDMHLKNFSLIENEKGYVLSKACDLLPVNLVMPSDNEEFALTMNGKKAHIRKKDFLVFAKEFDIPLVATQKIISSVLSRKEEYIDMIRDSFLSSDEKNRFIGLLNARLKVLE